MLHRANRVAVVSDSRQTWPGLDRLDHASTSSCSRFAFNIGIFYFIAAAFKGGITLAAARALQP